MKSKILDITVPSDGVLINVVSTKIMKFHLNHLPPYMDEDGGKWFKWNFMILIETALINTSVDENVTTKIFDFIHDSDNIKSYNWCGYVMSELIDTHKNWENNKTKRFVVPTIFVVVSFIIFLP